MVAVSCSLVAACRQHGLNQFIYLCNVTGRISGHPANRLEELLPDQLTLADLPATAGLPLVRNAACNASVSFVLPLPLAL